jgi:hypothetical protein
VAQLPPAQLPQLAPVELPPALPALRIAKLDISFCTRRRPQCGQAGFFFAPAGSNSSKT